MPVAIQPGAVKLSEFISSATHLGLDRTWVGERKMGGRKVRKKGEREKKKFVEHTSAAHQMAIVILSSVELSV